MLKINLNEAERFLTLLDESAEQFTFQTFDDNKQRKDQSLARVLNGSFNQHREQLEELNVRGAGVFVAVNETDLTGRKAVNIVRPRAVFIEDDHGGAPNPPGLEPHIVVQTSDSRKQHRYFLIDDATCNDLDEWGRVQGRMVLDYFSDPNAKDRARVLRMPGFFHQKDPANLLLVRIIHESGELPYKWEKIKRHIPPMAARETQRPSEPGDGRKLPELRSALAAIDPDCDYGDWLNVGMGLHYATNGGSDGLDLWDEWSRGDLSASHIGAKYPTQNPACISYKWNGFSSAGNLSGAITEKTIFKWAYEAGWQGQAKKGAEPPPRGENTNDDSEPTFKRVSLADVLINPPETQRYIWAGRVPFEELTLLAAHGGTGKSLFGLQLAAHTSTGASFLGLPTERVKTLFFSAEDATNTIRRRMAAICQADGLDPVELAKNLIVLDATAAPCLFQEISDKGVKRGEITAHYSELKAMIEAEGVGFLIVDNASDTFGANPIDRQAVTKFIRVLVQLVRGVGGAVLLLSHVNKVTSRNGKHQTDTEGYADSAAWHNAARSRLFLLATDDQGNLSLAHQKNNLGKKQPDLCISFREDGSSLRANTEQSQINKDLMRQIHRRFLLKLIHEFYSRGEWINPSANSAMTNVHAMLKAEAGFPFGASRDGKSECFALIRECERDGLLLKEGYKKPDRHNGQRWALTQKGLDLICEIMDKAA